MQDLPPVGSTYHIGSYKLMQHMDVMLVNMKTKRPVFYFDYSPLSRARVVIMT